MILRTRNAEETHRLGERLGWLLKPGDVVALIGELGAGKTTLTRGIASGLGVDSDIHSPTFTLVHEHGGMVPLYHIDLYRLDTPEEAAEIGVEDYFHGDGVTVVEWAERAEPLLPEQTLRVEIVRRGESVRELVFHGASPRASEILRGLKDSADTGG